MDQNSNPVKVNELQGSHRDAALPTTNRQEMSKQSNEQAVQPNTEKDIIFKDLDETEKINLKPYLYFLILYSFNAILILPISILKMFIEFLKNLGQSIMQFKWFKTVKVLFAYTIDILMAISVLMMYPLAFTPLPKHLAVNFQYWAISCLIFLQSYILLQSYMQTIMIDRKSLSFLDLISDENLNSLGLGRIVASFFSEQNKGESYTQALRKELIETVEDSLDEENIDPTLFFLTLENDKGLVTIDELQDLTKQKVRQFIEKAKMKLEEKIVFSPLSNDENPEEQEQKEKRGQILKLIRTQGFRGHTHIIDNLLWPHYQYIKKMKYFSKTKFTMIISIVIVLKCSFPIWAIMNGSGEGDQQMQYMLLGCFVGMYMNMISILKGLLINDDLKGKRYILNVLETLILQSKSEGEEPDEESIEDDDLPFNNKYKLDLSCNLSLESWDNARRLTIILDSEKQDMYETTFSFLAIYLLYTYIILSQDFLGFDLFPSLHDFFKAPIQEWNMFIDFLLISLLFLVRVNEGSMYNETFERLQETINKIASVYEDKKSLFDFYFNGNILYNIQNETYRNITHRVFCTATEKVLYALAQKDIKEISPNKFKILVQEQSKQRVLQLCATMEKLVSQIDFDSDHFCHRFLGLFKSDIAKVFSTFALLAYIFFHSKIKAYLKKEKKK